MLYLLSATNQNTANLIEEDGACILLSATNQSTAKLIEEDRGLYPPLSNQSEHS